MLKFMSFGSGSCGNCYYIGYDGFGILIDAGIGIRKLKKYFSDYDLSLNDIKCVLVTHDHADHVKTVGMVSKMLNVPVYATAKVHEGIGKNYCVKKKIDIANVRNICQGEDFVLGDFIVSAFHIPHDSLDNVGFEIKYGGLVFCLMTDIGHVTEDLGRKIAEADYLVIEANYDEEMLWTGVYPDYLKQRVSGGTGHLSNKQCADAILNNATDKLRHVWLCHLSQENNHPELARKTVELGLKDAVRFDAEKLCVDVLRRNAPSEIFEITV